jgi:hypothetical protein
MGKYQPLGEFLRHQQTDEVAMTFAEIERVIGAKLPPNSPNYPAWWSNNPTNNVMTKVWLDAGFRAEQVDVRNRRLVFRRTGTGARPAAEGQGSSDREIRNRHPLFGLWKGMIHVAPGVDLTEPADPDWGKVYD